MEILRGIIQIMNEQLELYKQLLDIEKDKKEMIINNKVVELNVLTQKEKLIGQKTNQLEDIRRLETAKYFKREGYRKRHYTISELLTVVYQADEKQQLIRLFDELTTTIQELKHVNNANQQLVETALEYINFSINLMQDDFREDVTYRHPMQGAQAYQASNRHYNNNKGE